ncbi:hypothetical protein NDU88_006436, partial [Pleurodeles waltl]
MDPKILILAMAALTMLSTEAFLKKAPWGVCHLFQYQTLLPSHLRVAQELRDKYGHNRLILVEKKVALAIRVLENISNSELSKCVLKPLHMLEDIRRSLGHCLISKAPGHQPSRQLATWLQEFARNKVMESQECLEKTVILNLIQMLNEDIKCAAYMDQCDQMVQHLSPAQALTTANQKQE